MEELTLDTLLARIQDQDDKVRAAAWQAAGTVGAAAIGPLAGVVQDGPLEISRAANRAIWQIVRHSGRPGAAEEKKAAIEALIEVFQDEQQPVQLRRDVAWMFSDILDDEAIDPPSAARFLGDPDLREDVRAALQRIGGPNAVAALKAGLETAPDDFKPNIACGLRALGVEAPDIPCQKLKPTKQTRVKPVGR